MKWFLILLAAFSANMAWADALQSLDYDNVYLEQKREIPSYPWKIGAAYGGEFGNAYLNVQSADLSVLHSLGNGDLGRFLFAGFTFNKYFAQDGSLTQSVNQGTGSSQPVSIEVNKPSMSGFGTLELLPFQGNLNFFSHEPLEWALATRVGAGSVFYQSSSVYPALMWSVGPQVAISHQVGLNVSMGQEIESPFQGSDRLYRWIGQAGAYVRF